MANARTPADIYRFDVDVDSDTAAANVLRFVGRGKRVLEIGAGPGSIARPLAEVNACRVSELELDGASVEILRGFCDAVVRHDHHPEWWRWWWRTPHRTSVGIACFAESSYAHFRRL